MAKSKLTPVGGYILVKPVTEDKKSPAGIVLPDTVGKEKPQKGEVIALGTGRLTEDGKKVPFNVKKGDVVLFKKYSPEEIEIDGEEYLIMTEDSVLGILS